MKIKDLYRLGEKVLGGYGVGNLPIINDLNAKVIERLKNEFVIIVTPKTKFCVITQPQSFNM